MARRSIVILVAAVLLAAGLGVAAAALSPAAAPGGDVRVMYPASLTNLMEDWIRPAFDRSGRYRFVGEGSGSLAMAQLMKDRVKAPDVFISSDPAVDDDLRGPRNGDDVSWWVTVARSQLVVAWNPAGAYNGAFTEVREQLRTVESVLQLPGLRLCRADPDLDPQGYQTLFALQLEEARSGQAALAAAVLGPPHNPRQVFDPETLVTRVQSGACDGGLFYEVQALEAGLPFVSLPPEVDLSDASESPVYATSSYVGPGGRRFVGAPITFTITIPRTTINARGAVAFVDFLLSSPGQQILAEQGLIPVPPTAGGDAGRVPAAIPTQPAQPSQAAPPAPTTSGGGGAPSG